MKCNGCKEEIKQDLFVIIENSDHVKEYLCDGCYEARRKYEIDNFSSDYDIWMKKEIEQFKKNKRCTKCNKSPTHEDDDHIEYIITSSIDYVCSKCVKINV